MYDEMTILHKNCSEETILHKTWNEDIILHKIFDKIRILQKNFQWKDKFYLKEILLIHFNSITS